MEPESSEIPALESPIEAAVEGINEYCYASGRILQDFLETNDFNWPAESYLSSPETSAIQSDDNDDSNRGSHVRERAEVSNSTVSSNESYTCNSNACNISASCSRYSSYSSNESFEVQKDLASPLTGPQVNQSRSGNTKQLNTSVPSINSNSSIHSIQQSIHSSDDLVANRTCPSPDSRSLSNLSRCNNSFSQFSSPQSFSAISDRSSLQSQHSQTDLSIIETIAFDRSTNHISLSEKSTPSFSNDLLPRRNHFSSSPLGTQTFNRTQEEASPKSKDDSFDQSVDRSSSTLYSGSRFSIHSNSKHENDSQSSGSRSKDTSLNSTDSIHSCQSRVTTYSSPESISLSAGNDSCFHLPNNNPMTYKHASHRMGTLQHSTTFPFLTHFLSAPIR